MTLRALVYPPDLGEHPRMDPRIGRGVVLDRDVGRDILAEATAREDEGQIPDMALGLGRDVATEDRLRADRAVTGDLHGIAEDVVVTDHTVV